MYTYNGENIQIDIYGGSHEPVIGVKLRGVRAGVKLERTALGEFMARRAPGRDKYSTPRVEADAVEFLSGVCDDITDGGEIHAIIRSTNQRSSDYSKFEDTPRPSHADYTARVKYGDSVNMAGGGPFSGRMTAPLCIAGGIALGILRGMGITVGAHIARIGDERDIPFDPVCVTAEQLDEIKKKPFPAADDTCGDRMAERILEAKAEGDSVGAVIECAAVGVGVGFGGPLFEGLESRIASLAFAVPAVKGVEFGSGFGCASMKGSEHNDPYIIRDGKIMTLTNNSGGIAGGISNGMPIIFRAALKPTPSIAKEQETVSLSRMETATLTIGGRHDPCVGVRAVPVIEAVCALGLLDAINSEQYPKEGLI